LLWVGTWVPGWKARGARAGYSVLNAAFFTLVLVTGTLAYIAWAVPVDAGMRSSAAVERLPEA
jgi:hypothetical protein